MIKKHYFRWLISSAKRYYKNLCKIYPEVSNERLKRFAFKSLKRMADSLSDGESNKIKKKVIFFFYF